MGYMVLSIYKDKRLYFSRIVPCIFFLAALLFNTWILGGLSSNARSDADGLGFYSFNLNGFFNPGGYSKVLPDLNRRQFQHEGFAYFGLGLMILVGLGILVYIACIVKGRKISFEGSVILGIAIVSMMFALSPVITWGNAKLFTIPFPEFIKSLWGIFRSTGRYIWVTWYLAAFFSIKEVGRIRIGNKENGIVNLGLIVLICCLLIQVYDISGVLMSKHKNFTKSKEYKLSNEAFWDLAVQYRDFNFINMAYSVDNLGDYIEIAAYALKYDMAMTSYYFARAIDGMYDHKDSIDREGYRADTIYVFRAEEEELLHKYEHELRYYDLGKYVIGISWLDADGQVNDFIYEENKQIE